MHTIEYLREERNRRLAETDWMACSDVTMSNAGAVTIADDAVTSAKIADTTIVARNIANDTITATQIAASVAFISSMITCTLNTRSASSYLPTFFILIFAP